MEVSKSKLENFLIKGTERTPEIEFKFDEKRGRIKIKGNSVSDNPSEFYKPLMNFIEEYRKKPSNLIEVDINLEYFNVSSSKYFLDMFKKLESIHKMESKVIINWYYKEEDILEAGEDFESMICIPFKMIEVSD